MQINVSYFLKVGSTVIQGAKTNNFDHYNIPKSNWLIFCVCVLCDGLYNGGYLDM